MTGSSKNKVHAVRKFLLWLTVSVLSVLLILLVSLKIYLASAHPAPMISRFVTSYLHQNFTVKRVQISRGALVLEGVRLENPSGFPQGNLAAADSVAVAPQWVDLLLGRGRFRLVALDGITVSLEKNAEGVWNYSQIQQLLAGRKPSATETYINELLVKNGAITVQGQGAQGIGLQVFNLTTKGSLDSRVDLNFEDAAHNRYALKGKARAGRDAAVDLALTAPSISLKGMAVMFKLKNPALFDGGKGALSVNAGFHQGKLSTSGDLAFSGLHFLTAGKTNTLAGTLQFAADYNLKEDTSRLQTCTLTVNNLLKLHAEGNARGVKGEREFALNVGMDEVDLAALNAMVSEETRKHMLIGGRLRCDSLHLEGNRSQGLRNATGTLQLHDGKLTRDGRLWVEALSGSIDFSRKDKAIFAKGRLSVPGRHDKALLETLDIPFGLTVSSRLKPLSAESPSLSASVMGVPVTGRIAFDAAKANPLSAALKVPAARLPKLNSLLGRFNLHAASGTASAEIEVAGKSAQEFNAAAKVQLIEVRASRGKESFAAKKGTVAATLQKRGGHLLAQGNAQLSAIAVNGKQGDAKFGFKVADRMLYLDAAQISAGDSRIFISHLSGPIPGKEPAANLVRFPVVLDLYGCAVKRGELDVQNLSGRLRGSFNTDRAGKWLEGTADLASGAVSWQAKTVAAPVVHAVFSRAGGRGEVSGRLFGGKLGGSVSFNPFAPEAGESFDLAVSGAGLAAAAQLLPRHTGVYPSEGAVDLRLHGGYSRGNGLACRFESKGTGIVLTKSGKMLVSGAGLSLTGALAGGNLSLGEAMLSAGKGVELKLKGEVAQAFSAKRKGSLFFSFPQSPLKAITGSLINVLPRFLQEAVVDGTMAADGKLDLREGRNLVEGAIVLRSGRIEVASQKLAIADIDGRLPFSIDLSGKAGAKPQQAMAFSKDNYPRLLEQLRSSSADGQVVTVGKIAFGALELGKLTMHVTAGNGITEITSLNSSLYEGALIGKAVVTMREKLFYRGDLLVNGLSLRALCSRFANIKGYISGRVDGVLSLSGGDKGLAGITGFTNLWAREGSGEKMLVSKEFLQRLSKQKLTGFFFSSDRPYDQAEIKGMLEEEDLSFDTLKIMHTNLFGVRDLNVSIVPGQNRISLQHLLDSIKEAVVRGAPKAGGPPARGAAESPAEVPATQEFKWGE